MTNISIEQFLGQESPLADVHNRADHRHIAIDQVGVSNIQFPVAVSGRSRTSQHTVARLSMSVNLEAEVKGAHMSRFVEILNEYQGEISINTLPALLRCLNERLNSSDARMKISFPFFLNRAAPVSGARGVMDYDCTLVGELKGTTDDYLLGVKVPVASLCPCSKEISDYGAHNQRAYITLQVRSVRTRSGAPAQIWLEDLIELAESCASAPVYPLLKRPDERFVTMQAYDNPMFVEDIAREVATKLQNNKQIAWFRVKVESMESIHNHDAFACIEWDLARQD